MIPRRLVQLPPPRGIAHHAILAEILRELRTIRVALTDETGGARTAPPPRTDDTLHTGRAGGLSSAS